MQLWHIILYIFSINNAHFVKSSGRIIFIHFLHIHNFAHPNHTKFSAQTETWEKKYSPLLGISKIFLYASHLNLLLAERVASYINTEYNLSRKGGTCPRGKENFLFWSFSEMRKEARDRKTRGKFSSSAEELPSHRRRIRLAKWGWIFSGTVQCSAVPRRIREVRRQGIQWYWAITLVTCVSETFYLFIYLLFTFKGRADIENQIYQFSMDSFEN